MKPLRSLIPTALAAAAALVGMAAAPPADAAEFARRHKIKPPHARVAPAGPAFGAPLADLDAASLAAFEAGREEFESVETPEGGLGPIFNDSSCAACHSAGGIGGASEQTVTRFGRRHGGRFDPLTGLGGTLLQAKAIDAALLEGIPDQANVTTRRVTTPVFGAGLIEAIPDDEIVLNALRRKPDGVRGRAAVVTDVASGRSRVGRFGWKAQHATLLSFAADAYLNEMGVTNRFFPHENAPNGRSDLIAPYVKPGVEDAPDPATGRGDVDALADFMRLLAPPPPLRQTAVTLAGARLFAQANCDACHVPTMITGRHANPALAHKPVPLFSDLLLHDMGRLGDGIEQGDATGREIRTAPLWGLRARPAYLHDGRATTVRQAIEWHDGEASPSRDRFRALRPVEQRALLDYLGTL